METRWRIKTLILQAFKALCYLDKNAIEVLLMSVLPLELVIFLSDIEICAGSRLQLFQVNDIKCNSSDLDRLKDVTLMLTMIYATGLKMPTSHPGNLFSLRNGFVGEILFIFVSIPSRRTHWYRVHPVHIGHHRNTARSGRPRNHSRHHDQPDTVAESAVRTFRRQFHLECDAENIVSENIHRKDSGSTESRR